MDGRSFDRLARHLARGGSRRGLVAGGMAALAALVGGARTSAGRPYSIPLGGVCYNDRQCIPPDPDSFDPLSNLVFCRDNGFDWDGEFNCCHYGDGWCRADSDCCGDLACNDGTCGYYNAGCGGYGEFCGDAGDCCGSLGCYAGYCSTPFEVCSGYGEFCREDLDCCGSLFCGPGYCTTPYE